MTTSTPIDPQLNPQQRPVKVRRQSLLGRTTAFFVFLFERVMPDPFVFAVLLTFLASVLAFLYAPDAAPKQIAAAWYAGVFNLFTFAFQMVIILTAGRALASAPAIRRLLAKIADLPRSPADAVSLIVVVSMAASWVNWGLGLVTAALLAREMAKRIPVDFGWLVAAGYTGYVISTEGLSGSIALSQSTHGSALNIVEKLTGHLTPLSETVFTKYNLIPIAALFVLLPLVFRHIGPTAQNRQPADPARLQEEDDHAVVKEDTGTFGAKLDHAWILNVLLVIFIGSALVLEVIRTHGTIDLNIVIMTLLSLGLLLHWRPAAYVGAIKLAARSSGSLILQYPLYGGLMGIITTTGLAGVLSKVFINYSTAHTLPFFTYLTSMIITLFVPSGGGHWAVQGPFAIPAAIQLHSSLAGTTMAVAMGESVANMIQPFWALPILAIAGIKMRRMMGFMVITFVVSGIVFGLSLLFLLPTP
ncbi:short-chain fatty acid transporter [Tunturibacter empetritectus]|uniref:Short-chain fatty acids transporter n=1 Tax=Tunturiibacter lichenicola TaxID=2051959 RepID=A0A7W8J9E8_9BACT|nr:TIGR00366 family protein [Edaphobacter lichenicola]MBB5343752.1 short-chain fatty acids transporter [Edaphobacter lichenicola]